MPPSRATISGNKTKASVQANQSKHHTRAKGSVRRARKKYMAHKQSDVGKDNAKPAVLPPGVDVIDVDYDDFEENEQSIKASTSSSLHVSSWTCGRCAFINDGVATENACVMCAQNVNSCTDTRDIAVTNADQGKKGADNDDDDDSITFVSNPSMTHRRSKRTKADDFPCYLIGNELCDTHPMAEESGGWIWARNHHFVNLLDESQEDVPGLVNAFKTMLRTRPPNEVTRDQVLGLAVQHGVICGKWLIYQKAYNAAQMWQKIRDALYENRLGGVAKIGKRPIEYGNFVICVYCDDFRDKPDLVRVRKALYEAAGITSKIGFKPDCFTYLDIYQKNPFKIRPTIYSCAVTNNQAQVSLNENK